MSEEDSKLPSVITKAFQNIRETVFGALDKSSRSVIQELNVIQDILRPPLKKVAMDMNRPYVEPTLDTDFLERWEQADDKKEVIEAAVKNYRELLQGVQERNKWRL